MDRLITSVFKNLKTNESRLAAYGFSKADGGYILRAELGGCGFTVVIYVTPPCTVRAKTLDDEGEPYTLHLVDDACGGFVGQVRSEYEGLLRRVAEDCFTPDAFKAPQSRLVAEYARNTHGDELEFLWADLPDCAVLRRADTRKWYAVFMTVGKDKLGLDGGDKVEILDIRVNPDELPSLIDGVSFFAGYHMNKKHWLTVVLDGGVDVEKIYKLLDDSYLLAKK